MGQQVLNNKIQKLRDYLDRLESYINFNDEEITQNDEKLLSMERLFQLLVDEAIDVNSAILYSQGKKVSESYKSSFYDMALIHVIEYSFADKISGSAGLRNNIVHDYDKLQKKDVVIGIKKFFDLYKEYTKILIEKFVAE